MQRQKCLGISCECSGNILDKYSMGGDWMYEAWQLILTLLCTFDCPLFQVVGQVVLPWPGHRVGWGHIGNGSCTRASVSSGSQNVQHISTYIPYWSRNMLDEPCIYKY